jgi:hypothetical protein
MDITEATYPVFEANQVLTKSHLNDLFEYLDEQNRLTRANLIGIGIVCGLELEFNGTTTIRLSKGCGITSEGYLILEPADVDLVAIRPYTLPADYGYPPFIGATQPPLQYPLWELLDDEDETGAVLLTDALLDLSQKAVVLFLELRRDGLRTCAPNDCDDRGAQVTATLRRLLVGIDDLDKIIAAADTSGTYLGADLTERLHLPDLRMPRFDVRNTGPVETAEVLRAFQEAFSANRLAAATSAALTALYAAFKPVVVDLFPTNPFTTFLNRFGFLDSSPVTTGQVRFLQYYWDLFDDLLAAYDELRWRGVDLLCACCPPAGLFPRHLMVGVLDPVKHDAADYRHRFVRSPAAGDCADRSRQVRQLFRRLVAMPATFREEAADHGIRATPSRWGDAPVSVKAIPFYYDQQGTPPLYELWDPVKTARRRANQNLSYRATEYVPAPPAFVTDPLRYDLEPNGFLRIEGHLGLNVQSALKILLSLRRSHRLPIEVVALRTGAFDENMSVDMSKEECRFRDLETLYDTLKAELDCFLVKQVEYFYELPFPPVPGAPVVIGEKALVPVLAVLRTRDPEFRAQPGTMGYQIEAALSWRPGRASPWIIAVPGVPDPPGQVYALVGVMSDLWALLADDLRQLDLAAMAERYRRLVEIAARIEEIRRSGAYDAPGLSDRLDDIIFRCRLDPFEALAEEWKRRLREAKQAQFLGHFLAAHPGVQHKAGVPLGGTFILVYHKPPERGEPRVNRRTLVEQALGRLQHKAELADDPDLGFVFEALTGKVLQPSDELVFVAADVYSDAVAELDDGTVVADFFLPYICCPGCATVQYQLPAGRLQVTTTIACTNGDGFAEVSVTTAGASGSLSVRADQGSFEELSGPLLLNVGEHTLVVRDSAGAESSPVQVTVPPTLRITGSRIEVNDAGDAWQVSFTIDGGTRPYAADVGAVVDQTYTSPALPVTEILTVQIKDAAGCTVAGRFESGVNPCDLPCEGEAIRLGYRFWLPEARPNFPINKYTPEVKSFVVTDAVGNRFDLSADVATVVRSGPDPTRPDRIGSADFGPTVQRWLTDINTLVARAVGSDQWLNLEYEAPAGEETTGTLFVDRLQCLDLAFELNVSFMQGRRQYQFQLSYRSGGTEIADLHTGSQARIPVFNASTSNKCRPDERPVLRCKGTDMTVEIGRGGVIPDAPPIVLRAATSGADQPVAFFWEIQDGTPSLASGDTVTVTFEPVRPVEKLVHLTAFTEQGCVVTRARLINISKPEG